MSDDLPLRWCAATAPTRFSLVLIACGAYREAARMYPGELIKLRQGARIGVWFVLDGVLSPLGVH
jgi:hypothetical protein